MRIGNLKTKKSRILRLILYLQKKSKKKIVGIGIAIINTIEISTKKQSCFLFLHYLWCFYLCFVKIVTFKSPLATPKYSAENLKNVNKRSLFRNLINKLQLNTNQKKLLYTLGFFFFFIKLIKYTVAQLIPFIYFISQMINQNITMFSDLVALHPFKKGVF